MKDQIIKEIIDWINSYKKDSITHRVLLGKSANIFKLINNQRQELIKKIEEHSVFTYPKDSNERIITFSMSEKVWEKEFKK